MWCLYLIHFRTGRRLVHIIKCLTVEARRCIGRRLCPRFCIPSSYTLSRPLLGGKRARVYIKVFLDVCILNFPFLLSLISLTRYRERVLRFAEPFLFQRFLRINEQLRAHRLDSNKGTETVDPKDSSRTGFFLGCIPFSVQYDPVRFFCWELFGTTQP